MKIFSVKFFLQRGMAMGGISRNEQIMANNKEEAIKKINDKYLDCNGGKFVLVSIEETGAQG